jgi:hypothetical protein
VGFFVQTILPASEMAHVIQLSVAPVFLLSGVGALLSVLTARVGRIVDRGRQIEVDLPEEEEHQPAHIHCELAVLRRRARWANRAISLCTTCALLICTLIVALFIGAFLQLDVSTTIALLFVFAMSALIFGLLCFLQEIYLATASLRLGRR